MYINILHIISVLCYLELSDFSKIKGVILLGNDNLIFLKKEDVKFISIPIWIDYVIYNDGKIEKGKYA